MKSPNDRGTLTKISNADLVRELKELVGRDRVLEAELLAYLGEVDARELYLEEACSSMFRYCTEVLHFSEGAAYSRITAARAGRRFPVILDRIRNGALHLCGVKLLAPHLTPENHLELLAAAEHKGKRAIGELLADSAPKPSVQATIRKLPRPPSPPPGLISPDRSDASASLQRTSRAQEESNAPPQLAPVLLGRAPPDSRARQEPLGQDRFRIQFTADRELHATLSEAQALLRHQVPDGDLAEIFRRGLKLLVAEVKRKRFASGVRRPRPRLSDSVTRKPSREIPASIRREVYERDEGRCTFVSETGRRCSTGEFLEFHHVDPWARFKRHRADRIVLLCSAHNQHAAVHDYGRRHMQKYRTADTTGRQLVPGRVASRSRGNAPQPGLSSLSSEAPMAMPERAVAPAVSESLAAAPPERS